VNVLLMETEVEHMHWNYCALGTFLWHYHIAYAAGLLVLVALAHDEHTAG
jgi:hypothetical protein